MTWLEELNKHRPPETKIVSTITKIRYEDLRYPPHSLLDSSLTATQKNTEEYFAYHNGARLVEAAADQSIADDQLAIESGRGDFKTLYFKWVGARYLFGV